MGVPFATSGRQGVHHPEREAIEGAREAAGDERRPPPVDGHLGGPELERAAERRDPQLTPLGLDQADVLVGAGRQQLHDLARQLLRREQLLKRRTGRVVAVLRARARLSDLQG
jgi:hypothetical protein